MVVELRVGWHPECPEDVKTAGLSREVVCLEDTDEELEEKEKVTMHVMAERDDQVKDVSEEFGIFREGVQLYLASCQIRGEKAKSLVEALGDERGLLVKAFSHGRELKRKFETLRSYESEHNVEPAEVIGVWVKDDVMGAFAEVSEVMLQGRVDLREPSILSPVINQECMGALEFVIVEVKKLESHPRSVMVSQLGSVTGGVNLGAVGPAAGSPSIPGSLTRGGKSSQRGKR